MTKQGNAVGVAFVFGGMRFHPPNGRVEVLEVRGPRVPCGTFAERMGERGWVTRFAAHGRSGAYLRVVQPGEIRPGDPITVTLSGSGLDLPTLLRTLLRRP